MSTQTPLQETKPKYWIHFMIFGVILFIALYPYIKHKVPAIERLFEPSAKSKRLGNQYFRQKQWQKALVAFQQASKRKSVWSYIFRTSYKRSRALIHYKMAICALRLNLLKKSASYAHIASSLAPSWTLPYELLVRLYAHQQQLQKFNVVANKMRVKFAKQWQTWVAIGNGYSQLKRHDNALKAYAEGFAINPNNPHLLNNYAWELLQDKPSKARIQRAKQLVQKAMKLSRRQDFTAFDTMALAYLLERDFTRAKKSQQQAIHIATTWLARYRGQTKQPDATHPIQLALGKMKKQLARIEQQANQATQPTKRPTAQNKSTKPARPTSRPASRPAQPAIILPPLPERRIRPLPRETHHQRSHQILLPQ